MTDPMPPKAAHELFAGWGGEQLDIDGYFTRLGYQGSTEPGPAALKDLHRAHRAAIPFENLNIPIGHGVDASLDAIEQKLVKSRRGGYCYEQNQLFAAVLERLGYRITGLGARVRVDSEQLRSTSHAAVLVEFEDSRWLTDVGFGALSLLEPIELRDGNEAVQGGWRYRLDEVGGEWVLSGAEAGGWQHLYSFPLTPYYSQDYQVLNYFTATNPLSPFTRRPVAQYATEERRYHYSGLELTVSTPDFDRQVTPLTPGEIPGVLQEVFGIALDEGETARLLDFIRALPPKE